MRLWLILAAVMVLMFWLRRRRTPPHPEQEEQPRLPATEIELLCPACGHGRWQVRGRLSPKKALVLSCSSCGRTISFEGDMERVDHHPSRPK
ncbi:MAG: hypothetical protein V3U31_06775 [Dehalococcoidia bacterium]